MTSADRRGGVEVTGPMHDRYDEVLTRHALAFLGDLHRTFDVRRRELRALREQRYQELAAGGTLDFLAETKDIRDHTSSRVADPAPSLVDRRVEITGPTDRKMTINALNSGARVWLADHEDANTQLWENMVEGQCRSCGPTPSCSSAPATSGERTRSAAWPPSSRAARTKRSTAGRSPRCARTRRERRTTASTGRGSSGHGRDLP